MRTLYLTVIDTKLLHQKWNINPVLRGTQIIGIVGNVEYQIVVKCRKDGTINWDKTAIYKMDELVGRKVVFLKHKTNQS